MPCFKLRMTCHRTHAPQDGRTPSRDAMQSSGHRLRNFDVTQPFLNIADWRRDRYPERRFVRSPLRRTHAHTARLGHFTRRPTGARRRRPAEPHPRGGRRRARGACALLQDEGVLRWAPTTEERSRYRRPTRRRRGGRRGGGAEADEAEERRPTRRRNAVEVVADRDRALRRRGHMDHAAHGLRLSASWTSPCLSCGRAIGLRAETRGGARIGYAPRRLKRCCRARCGSDHRPVALVRSSVLCDSAGVGVHRVGAAEAKLWTRVRVGSVLTRARTRAGVLNGYHAPSRSSSRWSYVPRETAPPRRREERRRETARWSTPYFGSRVMNGGRAASRLQGVERLFNGLPSQDVRPLSQFVSVSMH